MRAAWALAALCAGCERPAPSCPIVQDSIGDGGGVALDGARPARILVYSRTTGFRHESIATAVDAVRALAQAEGLAMDASESLSDLTEDNLARYGAIVAISATGEPFGADDGPSMRATLSFVERGGGWLGLHAVGDAYPCGRYPSFVGATFRSHPGDTRAARCFATASHPAVDQLPPVYELTDEIHLFHNFRADNRVVLACESAEGTERVPIAWHRSVGAGRLFVSALGHPPALWRDAVFLQQHVRPALRWVLGGS